MTPEQIVTVALGHASRVEGMPGWPERLDALRHSRTRAATIVEFAADDGRSRLEVWIDSVTGESIEIRYAPADGPQSHFYIAKCRP